MNRYGEKPQLLSSAKNFSVQNYYFFVCLFCLMVISFLLYVEFAKFFHWFLIPVIFSGLLIGVDAIKWLTGKYSLFDPQGITGIIGLHMFFFAPLLHVLWDFFMRVPFTPPDWREWLGWMAFLNCFGLLFYRSSVHFVRRRKGKAFKTKWTLDTTRFFIVLCSLLIISGAMQVWIYSKFGGISGYMLAYSERGGAFQSMGILFMISESFPILTMIGFVAFIKYRKLKISWPVVLLVLSIFFVEKMFFGGFRGSRSNTIWGLFWAVGLIHFWVRPIGKKLVAFGVILVLCFMVSYSYYKSYGLNAVDVLSDPAKREQLQRYDGRPLEGVLLVDFARADIQSYVLYRLCGNKSDFSLGLGRTYLGGLALVIPRSIWPNRPPGKLLEGSEIMYGKGSYLPGQIQTSRIFGLAGEGMLNFGMLGVLFVFSMFGIFVGKISRFMDVLTIDDSRILLMPLFSNLTFMLLASDMDNLVFFLIKNGFLPVFLIFVSSKKYTIGTPCHMECKG